MRDIYNGNFKTLKKVVEQVLEGRKTSHTHGDIGKGNTVKWLYYQNRSMVSTQSP